MSLLRSLTSFLVLVTLFIELGSPLSIWTGMAGSFLVT